MSQLLRQRGTARHDDDDALPNPPADRCARVPYNVRNAQRARQDDFGFDSGHRKLLVTIRQDVFDKVADGSEGLFGVRPVNTNQAGVIQLDADGNDGQSTFDVCVFTRPLVDECYVRCELSRNLCQSACRPGMQAVGQRTPECKIAEHGLRAGDYKNQSKEAIAAAAWVSQAIDRRKRRPLLPFSDIAQFSTRFLGNTM